MDQQGHIRQVRGNNALARGCAKIVRFDAGATLVDVNRAQPYFSKNYRKPSLIILIGLDQTKTSGARKYTLMDAHGFVSGGSLGMSS